MASKAANPPPKITANTARPISIPFIASSLFAWLLTKAGECGVFQTPPRSMARLARRTQLVYHLGAMTRSNEQTAPALPITLVGLMGVGKTTIGRRLAARLGRPFLDADAEVEAAAGRTVAEIFADFGETAFRDGERKVIARLLEKPKPVVLALGGGAFMDPDTRALIKARAISVWLRADLDTLYERVMRKPGQRPLLETDDPRAVLERLHAERAPVYAQADITVDSDASSHDTTVARLVEALETVQEGPEA
jgi:shikimate kinase